MKPTTRRPWHPRTFSLAISGKAARLLFTLLGMLLSLVPQGACGADEGAPAGPIDGATGGTGSDGGCAPQSASGFTPSWKPPRTTLHACTEVQIENQFTRCENEATYTATGCSAFNRDPAHAACRKCLYSTEDESSYGPLLYLKNRILRVNVPGCLALADGDLSVVGCGARSQAASACGDAACVNACPSYDGFQQCVTQASDTVCRSYRDNTACGDRATYASCLGYATFGDYYRGVAKLFCAGGFPGGGTPDGGGTSDGGGLDEAEPHRAETTNSVREQAPTLRRMIEREALEAHAPRSWIVDIER